MKNRFKKQFRCILCKGKKQKKKLKESDVCGVCFEKMYNFKTLSCPNCQNEVYPDTFPLKMYSWKALKVHNIICNKCSTTSRVVVG